jgi:orotate phosphoribosyltransferase
MTVNLSSLLVETGALLEGHFLLSSGLHSDRYVQCARLLCVPSKAETACRALADLWHDRAVDKVVGPALGAVVVAYELARQLNCQGLFTERVDGAMALRRGFEIHSGERVLVVEDVVTTGKSARELAELMRSSGAEVVGLASLIDRSVSPVDFVSDFRSLMRLEFAAFDPEDCPMCRAGSVPVKPGSRPQP